MLIPQLFTKPFLLHLFYLDNHGFLFLPFPVGAPVLALVLLGGLKKPAFLNQLKRNNSADLYQNPRRSSSFISQIIGASVTKWRIRSPQDMKKPITKSESMIPPQNSTAHL